MTTDLPIMHVDRLDLTFEPQPWAFAVERRAEIDAWFADLQRAKPAIWNGRVLLLHRRGVSAGVLHGAYLETDYASFAAWRSWGSPEAGVRDCFSAAAIVAADGAVLLGVMGSHTFNAGKIYFPCGTPDPDDRVGNRVDLARSLWRELKEETGFAPADFEVAPGWVSIKDGPLWPQIKLLQAREDAETLQARMRAHLARERQPELSGVHVVRRPDDVTAAMQPYVRAFLQWHFGWAAPAP